MLVGVKMNFTVAKLKKGIAGASGFARKISVWFRVAHPSSVCFVRDLVAGMSRLDSRSDVEF